MNLARSIAFLRSGWMALAVVILAAALVSAGWYYYSETRAGFDEEMGRRLKALADLAAAEISYGAGPSAEGAFADSLVSAPMRSRLERMRAEHALYNIIVLRDDFMTLASLQPAFYFEGHEYAHWRADYEAILSALRGTTAATPLHRAQRGFLKAAYAPIRIGADETAAVVGVEADVGFLSELERLRRILIAATGISAAGIALFVIFALQATSSLVRARESLMSAQSLAAMGRMAAGVAHEIRNPLFIIRSAAEKLAARHPESSDDVKNYLLDEVDRLNGILTDYLLFAKDEPSRNAPMDLVSTLNRCARNFRDSILEPAVAVETSFDAPEAPFVGEEKRIQQAFLNILINAGQALVKGGTIAVSLTRRRGRYHVEFRDTGAGIAPKDLDRIFEPFFTTKSHGSGLGLAITKKIVEAHGGEIAIESEPGAGTTVRVVLPAPEESHGSGGGGRGA